MTVFFDKRAADNESEDGAAMIATTCVRLTSVLRQACPQLCMRTRFESMRANADDPWTFSCVGPALTILSKEINTSFGPLHPTGTGCKLTGAANAQFKTLQYRIEPGQMPGAFGIHLDNDPTHADSTAVFVLCGSGRRLLVLSDKVYDVFTTDESGAAVLAKDRIRQALLLTLLTLHAALLSPKPGRQ